MTSPHQVRVEAAVREAGETHRGWAEVKLVKAGVSLRFLGRRTQAVTREMPFEAIVSVVT